MNVEPDLYSWNVPVWNMFTRLDRTRRSKPVSRISITEIESLFNVMNIKDTDTRIEYMDHIIKLDSATFNIIEGKDNASA